LGAYAAAAHVRIFTIGVRDAIWSKPLRQDLPSSSMGQLAAAAGGTFSQAVPNQERKDFLQIESALTSEYVLRYRSAQRYGLRVGVAVRIDGVPGMANLSYLAPPAPRILPAIRHKSFWTSSLAVAVVAVSVALLIGLAVAVLLTSYSHAGLVRSRVSEFVPEYPISPADGLIPEISRPRGLGMLLEGRKWWPAFVEQVSISGFTRSPQQLVRLAVAGSLISAVLLDLITGSLLLAIVGLAIGPLVLRVVVRRKVQQERLHFAEQLPGQLHEVASAMRTGRSLIEGFEVVAESADEPMRRELRRALSDERAGLHLDEALLPVAERMDSAEIEQVAVIGALHRRTGSNITEVLDRIADTARQRVEIRRELQGMTAQARMSRNILTALPVFVTLAIDLIGHKYERPLFHTLPGVLVLIVGAMMVALGSRVMKAIVNIEE
jgi:tight adherence protein B